GRGNAERGKGWFWLPVRGGKTSTSLPPTAARCPASGCIERRHIERQILASGGREPPGAYARPGRITARRADAREELPPSHDPDRRHEQPRADDVDHT